MCKTSAILCLKCFCFTQTIAIIQICVCIADIVVPVHRTMKLLFTNAGNNSCTIKNVSLRTKHAYIVSISYFT